MPYPWIDDYLLQKPGVTKDLQPDWNWIPIRSAANCSPPSAWTIRTSRITSP